MLRAKCCAITRPSFFSLLAVWHLCLLGPTCTGVEVRVWPALFSLPLSLSLALAPLSTTPPLVLLQGLVPLPLRGWTTTTTTKTIFTMAASSSFSKSATEMLRAAEDALAGRSGFAGTPPDFASPTLLTQKQRSGAPAVMLQCSTADMVDLQYQLNRTMRELIELRAELTVEREKRNEVIAAMGRQWKEELLVEVRRRDGAIEGSIAALEERVATRWRDDNERQLVLRRQVDDALRAAKIRDGSQFELREELHTSLQHMEERVDAALAQSAAGRVDCAEQVEKAGAALSRRLDTELIRFADMRRDDQRALQEVSYLVKHEANKLRSRVQEMVDEVWSTSSASLIKSATAPVEALKTEQQQAKAAVHAMEERVAECVHSCRAECTLHTTTTVERIHALESKEAAASSRIDRAERKADAAYDTATRVDASAAMAKAATERAEAQAVSAMERAQRMEHLMTDREGRLIAVESQLASIATAEGLRVDIEACRRQAARLEGRVEAAGAVSSRAEEIAERAVHKAEMLTERMCECEKSSLKSMEAVQAARETLDQYDQRVAAVRSAAEVQEGVLQRQTHLASQLEQRIIMQEGRITNWQQQQAQLMKDQQTSQQQLSDRIESNAGVTTRAQQTCVEVKNEVLRLEKRLESVTGAASTLAEKHGLVMTAIEKQRSIMREVQQHQQRTTEWMQAVEQRLSDDNAPHAKLEEILSVRLQRSEADIQRGVAEAMQRMTQRLGDCESQIQENTGRMQSSVQDALRHHASELQRKVHNALQDGVSRVARRVEATEAVLEQVQETITTAPERLSALELQATQQQRSLRSTDAKLGALQTEVEQISSRLAQSLQDDHLALVALRRDFNGLSAQQQQLHQAILLRQRTSDFSYNTTQPTADEPTMFRVPANTLAEAPSSHLQTSSTVIAVNDAEVSSPSVNRPSSPLVLPPARRTENTIGLAQTSTVAAAPPPPSLPLSSIQQQQQQRQETRASPGETDSSKKQSSDRAPSHLSALSSVYPATGDEKLRSVVEAAASDSDDVVDVFSAPSTSGGTTTIVPQALQTTGAAQNVSQQTAIREFTALEDTTETSETSPAASRRLRITRRRADDSDNEEEESTDNITALTFTSAATSPRRQSSPVPRSSGAPQSAGADVTTNQQNAVAAPATETLSTESRREEEEDDVVPLNNSDDSDRSGSDHGEEDEDDGVRQESLVAEREQASPPLRRSLQKSVMEATVTSGMAPAELSSASHPLADTSHTSTLQQRLNHGWDTWDDDEEDEEEEAVRGHGEDASVDDDESGANTAENSDGSEDVVLPMNGGGEGAEGESAAVSSDHNSSELLDTRDESAEDDHFESPARHGDTSETESENPALRVSPRRVFVHSDEEDEQHRRAQASVPRHGLNTTSSSSSSGGPAEGQYSAAGVLPAAFERTPIRQYTNFDDSTTSEDEAEEE